MQECGKNLIQKPQPWIEKNQPVAFLSMANFGKTLQNLLNGPGKKPKQIRPANPV